MAALLRLQRSLDCLAVFCAAIADGRQSEQSQQCRTHSKGRFHHTSLRENSAQRLRPRGHSAGEKETAALAAAMWSAAPDRQREYCSLFVLAVSRTKSERR